MGMHYNSTLRELDLSRNSVLAGGAKRIARALEASQSLACLDLSGQRFEGLGARGAEAVATLIRYEAGECFVKGRRALSANALSEWTLTSWIDPRWADFIPS